MRRKLVRERRQPLAIFSGEVGDHLVQPLIERVPLTDEEFFQADCRRPGALRHLRGAPASTPLDVTVDGLPVHDRTDVGLGLAPARELAQDGGLGIEEMEPDVAREVLRFVAMEAVPPAHESDGPFDQVPIREIQVPEGIVRHDWGVARIIGPPWEIRTSGAVYWAMSNDGLSPREREIVLAVARGLSNRDIASVTGIAQQTVKNHLSTIFHKLNVRSRVQLAILALQSGLTTPPL